MDTLDTILLGTDIGTGKSDHMVNIGKLITFNEHLALQALSALHIVRRVAASPSTQSQLLALYTKTPALTTGFPLFFNFFLESYDLLLNF